MATVTHDLDNAANFSFLCRSPASIGCIIVVTGLFFGPFLQNTVEPELRWRDARNGSETASLPVISNYAQVNTKSSSQTDTDFFVAPVPVQAALGRGWFFGTSLQSLQGIGAELNEVLYTAECSTANCTWTDFSTLMLRHSCVPATFDVREETLPSGLPRLVAVSQQARLTTTRPHPNIEDTTMYTNLNLRQSRVVPPASSFAASNMAVLAHVGIMGDFNGTGSDFEAIECVFYWAAVRASANFTNGVLTEAQKDIHFLVEDGGGSSGDGDFRDVSITAPWPCAFNATGPESDESCVYTVTRNAQHGLYNSFRPYLNGWSARFLDGDAGNSTAEDEVPDTTMRHSSLQTDTLYWGWTEMVIRRTRLIDTMDLFFSNIDFFVTTTLRMSSLERHASLGVARVENVFFKVNPEYILLPGIMLALSVLFFLAVAIWTRKEYAWRNSQLPLIYHGLENPGPRDWGVTSMAGMWEAASVGEVKMNGGKNGGELRLQRWGDEGQEYWQRPGGV